MEEELMQCQGERDRDKADQITAQDRIKYLEAQQNLVSDLRLVPAPGVSSCPSSDWSPLRVYPLVLHPIGPRPGYILSSFIRLVPTPGISSCPSFDWSPPQVYPLVPPPIGPPTPGVSSCPSSDWSPPR
eukprot:1386097-Pyramimonas_sp.AAC.1